MANALNFLRACLRNGTACLVLLLTLLASPIWAAESPLIVLDAGHTPELPGALGIAGRFELFYNERFVAELAPRLEQAGWRVRLTHEPGEDISLPERTARANRMNADLFLAIHHDSTRAEFVERITFAGREFQRTREPFSGSSFHVSMRNPRFRQSLRLARFLGHRVQRLGREPALYHADPVRGENRPLIDANLGIYRRDNLAVLRRTKMPAVLFEVGVLPDPADHAWLDTPENRTNLQNALVRGLADYRRSLLKSRENK